MREPQKYYALFYSSAGIPTDRLIGVFSERQLRKAIKERIEDGRIRSSRSIDELKDIEVLNLALTFYNAHVVPLELNKPLDTPELRLKV